MTTTLLDAIKETKPGQELYVWGGQEGWNDSQRICCVIPRSNGLYDVYNSLTVEAPCVDQNVEEAFSVALEMIDEAGYGNKIKDGNEGEFEAADIRWVCAGKARS
jgi:hypothetical protein